MVLLTPPSSSHRRDKDKENKFFQAGPSTRSVVWDDNPEIHCLSTPFKTLTIPSKQRPSAKHSILKKFPATLVVPLDTKKRECTPEPSEILRNETYLTRPLTQILSVQDPDSSESLAALIEGYNVLGARLRNAVTESSDGDSDWPLFQPLRQNTDALVSAIIRDLGRALVDPLSSSSPFAEADVCKCLPSPEKSPTRKKRGMTGEQAKYARDLCTTCHSVIRLLSVILALPRFYKLFDENQLRQILAAVLAIPLADDLPTPTSRKTYAIVIWLIQLQRLPAAILQPAADRIAYALRRGIVGELGKEGKKGSVSDGLKAIYDLCEYLPEVFVPAFVPIVPAILSNLLASTLNIRAQACHALGGLVLGLTSIPPSSAHTKISSMVASYLNAPGTPTKSDPSTMSEPSIVRTLRTTMSQAHPDHPAQGPVWALCVLASFIVLMNSRLCTNLQANQTLCNLLALGLRQKKSSVRALTCLTWRCLSWSYLQPPLPMDCEGESEVDEDAERTKMPKRAQIKVMMSVLECQTGIANIAVLLGSKTGEEPLRLSLQLLQLMAAKSGHPCYDATQTMMQMVSLVNGESNVEQEPWDPDLFFPKSLFSASNGLFAAEYKNLTQTVRPLFENLASVGDVRPLTREELIKEWVLDGMMTTWKLALGHLELNDEADLPPELVTTWVSLMKANVDHYGDDVSAISKLGTTFMRYVSDVLEDPDLDLRPNEELSGVGPANRNKTVPDSDEVTPTITGSTMCTNNELRLRVVCHMWNAMKNVFPRAGLVEAAEMLLACLMRKEQFLLTENARAALDEESEEERNSWVLLCVDAARIIGSEGIRVFWGCEEGGVVQKSPRAWAWAWTKEFTNAVWKTSVEKWRDDDGDWEGAVVLLGVPFTDKHTWNPTSEDFNIWEGLLGYAIDNALDHGVDSSAVLDNISSFVSSFQTPSAQPYLSIRLADLLLSHLDIPEMRILPQSLIGLISETLRANYPPEVKNKTVMRWLVRSLMTLVDKCPLEFCLQILQGLEDGISLWLADEYGAWDEDEFNYDMIPLYQHILISLQGLTDPPNVLCSVDELVVSVFNYRTPKLAVDAFVEFWTSSCACAATPIGGWPESISRTLRVVGLLPMADVSNPVILSSAFDSPPRTPISYSYSTPSPSKRRKVARVSLKPHKLIYKLPTSPISPTAHRQLCNSFPGIIPRTPLSSRTLIADETLCKRRRISSEGKENMGISDRPLASVAERIAEILNRKRKHQMEDDDEEEDALKDSPVPCRRKRMRERMKPKSTKLISNTIESWQPTESDEDRKDVEQALLKITSPEKNDDDSDSATIVEIVDTPSRPKFVYGRTHTSLSAPYVKGGAEGPKIDFVKMLQDRNGLRRSCSSIGIGTGNVGKRKWSDRDDDEDDDEFSRMGQTLKRTMSMPERLRDEGLGPESTNSAAKLPSLLAQLQVHGTKI